MNVRRLGYICLEATDVDAWKWFGTEILGLMLASGPDPESAYFRIDDRPFRIAVTRGDRDRLLCAGWQLPDASALAHAVAELGAAGVAVKEGSPGDAALRCVEGLVRCEDPAGNALELFHSPAHDQRPFISPVGVSRFVTGELGMGHLVVPASPLAATFDFYTRLLGFGHSDSMRLGEAPADGGADGDRGSWLRFLHCNPRHHSLGLLEWDAPPGIFHFLLEAGTLDDVGRALDRCHDHSIPIEMTLGKHTNDQMISFYARTPGGFNVEFGTGGLCIDRDTWTTQEIMAVSFWGHRSANH